MVGNFGQAEVLSFHATKFFNSFEGGAVVTNDDTLAEKVRLMRNFGFAGTDQVIYIGVNGKMTEVCAAMGITSLESLDDFVQVNLRNYEAYYAALANIPGVKLIDYDKSERNNYHYIIVEVDQERAGLSRDDLVRVLVREGVLARRYFYPGCHRMEPYRSFYPHSSLLLPETERLTSRVLSLPNGTALGAREVSQIGGIIQAAISEAPKVRDALSRSN
jgi:dTDP-4-amino-4,6-dideoxygalactose transaminase